MAKDFEMGYLLDFYGEVLTPKQRFPSRGTGMDDTFLIGRLYRYFPFAESGETRIYVVELSF